MTHSWTTDGPLGGETHVIEPQGEIDLATAPDLKARLLGILDDGRRFVVVDLEDVGFIDSAGVRVLLTVQRRLLAAGGGLTVVCTDPLIRRVFEVTGVAAALNLQHSRKDALMWVRHFAPAR